MYGVSSAWLFWKKVWCLIVLVLIFALFLTLRVTLGQFHKGWGFVYVHATTKCAVINNKCFQYDNTKINAIKYCVIITIAWINTIWWKYGTNNSLFTINSQNVIGWFN